MVQKCLWKKNCPELTKKLKQILKQLVVSFFPLQFCSTKLKNFVCLQKRQLYIAKKCAQSAFSFLTEQISQQKLTQLQQSSLQVVAQPPVTTITSDNPPANSSETTSSTTSTPNLPSQKKTVLQDRVEKIWWFMDNIDPNNSSTFKSALVEFLNFYMSVDTIIPENEQVCKNFHSFSYFFINFSKKNQRQRYLLFKKSCKFCQQLSQMFSNSYSGF